MYRELWLKKMEKCMEIFFYSKNAIYKCKRGRNVKDFRLESDSVQYLFIKYIVLFHFFILSRKAGQAANLR